MQYVLRWRRLNSTPTNISQRTDVFKTSSYVLLSLDGRTLGAALLSDLNTKNGFSLDRLCSSEEVIGGPLWSAEDGGAPDRLMGKLTLSIYRSREIIRRAIKARAVSEPRARGNASIVSDYGESNGGNSVLIGRGGGGEGATTIFNFFFSVTDPERTPRLRHSMSLPLDGLFKMFKRGSSVAGGSTYGGRQRTDSSANSAYNALRESHHEGIDSQDRPSQRRSITSNGNLQANDATSTEQDRRPSLAAADQPGRVSEQAPRLSTNSWSAMTLQSLDGRLVVAPTASGPNSAVTSPTDSTFGHRARGTAGLVSRNRATTIQTTPIVPSQPAIYGSSSADSFMRDQARRFSETVNGRGAKSFDGHSSGDSSLRQRRTQSDAHRQRRPMSEVYRDTNAPPLPNPPSSVLKSAFRNATLEIEKIQAARREVAQKLHDHGAKAEGAQTRSSVELDDRMINDAMQYLNGSSNAGQNGKGSALRRKSGDTKLHKSTVSWDPAALEPVHHQLPSVGEEAGGDGEDHRNGVQPAADSLAVPDLLKQLPPPPSPSVQSDATGQTSGPVESVAPEEPPHSPPSRKSSLVLRSASQLGIHNHAGESNHPAQSGLPTASIDDHNSSMGSSIPYTTISSINSPTTPRTSDWPNRRQSSVLPSSDSKSGVPPAPATTPISASFRSQQQPAASSWTPTPDQLSVYQSKHEAFISPLESTLRSLQMEEARLLHLIELKKMDDYQSSLEKHIEERKKRVEQLEKELRQEVRREVEERRKSLMVEEQESLPALPFSPIVEKGTPSMAEQQLGPQEQQHQVQQQQQQDREAFVAPPANRSPGFSTHGVLPSPSAAAVSDQQEPQVTAPLCVQKLPSSSSLRDQASWPSPSAMSPRPKAPPPRLVSNSSGSSQLRRSSQVLQSPRQIQKSALRQEPQARQQQPDRQPEQQGLQSPKRSEDGQPITPPLSPPAALPSSQEASTSRQGGSQTPRGGPYSSSRKSRSDTPSEVATPSVYATQKENLRHGPSARSQDSAVVTMNGHGNHQQGQGQEREAPSQKDQERNMTGVGSRNVNQDNGTNGNHLAVNSSNVTTNGITRSSNNTPHRLSTRDSIASSSAGSISTTTTERRRNYADESDDDIPDLDVNDEPEEMEVLNTPNYQGQQKQRYFDDQSTGGEENESTTGTTLPTFSKDLARLPSGITSPTATAIRERKIR